MLCIRNVTKQYRGVEVEQTALDHVTLNLRDSEFVSVLGPSGSGKTTLLNVLGGLDRYDEGDMLVDDTSTKGFSERDWDTYRNHSVGFVFQSYNLIPHQSVLENVALALTIAGAGPAERRERATRALQEVGLGEQLHKLPNQLSGGQMQRVAVARALVNDPRILLADEPTGALDTETSLQVMELLKEVSRNRLVVMVTHNPDLAERYSTRIVNLCDGRIVGDTDPFEPTEKPADPKGLPSSRKSSMGFSTALGLSFDNLRTKKGRTLLTAFAGSIGIIGIALILALSNGVRTYIDDMQRDTMVSYPLVINAQEMDVSALMDTAMGAQGFQHGTPAEPGRLDVDFGELEPATTTESSLKTNNLTAFKAYLDDPASAIRSYVGANGVVYDYDTSFSVYTRNENGDVVDTNADPSTVLDPLSSLPLPLPSRRGYGPSELLSALTSSTQQAHPYNFAEIMKGADGEVVSPLVKEGYEVLDGRWPETADEAVLAVNSDGSLPVSTLYQLGLITAQEYRDAASLVEQGEVPDLDISYASLLGHRFFALPAALAYQKEADGLFVPIGDDPAGLAELLDEALGLTIVGVVRPTPDANVYIGGAVGYTALLTDELIRVTDESPVVRAQEAEPTVNVLTGLPFEGAADQQKAEAARSALGLGAMASSLAGLGDDDLAVLYDEYLGTGSYEENLRAFGKVDRDAPSSIRIYTDSFEDKDGVTRSIAEYNEAASPTDHITYTDYVGLLTGSLTSMVNAVSAVLIAFVAVSLLVSCIMIGIITHISVLERTKEIGILRALGASRHNISQVFNAETVIVGLLAGLLGIGLSLLLTVPINAVSQMFLEADGFAASLPPTASIVLVAISVAITVAGGLIPARKAAKKDPVAALRSE